MLAACGGSQPPISAPGAMPQTLALAPRTNSSNYKVVYSFGTPPDAGCPLAGLIDVRGTLYGTTIGGGANASYDCTASLDLYGTVFSVTPSGREKVVYSFPPAGSGSQTHGSLPVAALIDVGGTLYSTTRWGGTSGAGTVFSVTTSGTENVLHSFSGRPDGAEPAASLIELKGELYGTTQIGGSHLNWGGTVFSLTTDGTEKTLHTFRGRQGSHVVAALVDVGGALYGTAWLGGAYHKGVVFSMTPSGREKVLHSFGNGTDGANPTASLIKVNGALYGTTEVGGSYHTCSTLGGGCGTVFSITPSGTEEVLHSFGNGTDGADPKRSLIDVNGTLYGTTTEGGAYNGGTVFSITPSGTENVLHSFSGGTDGAHPVTSLIDVNGTLYGTTEYGGAANTGTVFALQP
jgi:uncharacterized repeat protein (TIGR03803 family)